MSVRVRLWAPNTRNSYIMKFTVTEWHRVATHKYYEWDDDMIVEEFGSIERLEEIMSHQEQEMFSAIEPYGDEPTPEEDQRFWELTWETECDRDDDWITERKGGYDVTVKPGIQGEE